MKSSNGHKAAIVEAGQTKNLNGRQVKNGKAAEPLPDLLPLDEVETRPNFDTPSTRSTRSLKPRKGQTGKLQQWLAQFDESQTQKKNTVSESLGFLQTLVEGSPDAIFIKDGEGRYLFVNDTFGAWMQRDPHAVLGKTDTELFHQAIAQKLAESDPQVLADGRAFTEEIWLDDGAPENAGAERSLLTTKVPFRDKDNQIVGLFGMARDNTLRKLMEEELREAKQFNEQVIAHAREGVVVYDADLRYIVWNSFMEEFSGLPRHRVIGRHPLEVFPTIRESGMMEQIERALAGETIIGADTLVNSAQGAKTAWARCLFGPLRDAKGDVTGVIGLISDISEYKRTEARLRRSQQFNHQVIANASEGIAVYDRELRCMVWNPVLEDLSGLMGDDVLGRPILELAPAWRAAGLGQMLQQALQGDTVEAPDFLMGPQGDRWVSARYSPLTDNDEQVIGVIGILTDVTARRQAEDALRESQQFNQQIIDSALEGIAVYDRELTVVVWNPAMAEITGTHSAQVLGENVIQVFPYLESTESPAYWRRALAGETIRGRQFAFSGHSDKWVEASYGPLCNPHGEIVGVLVTMRDITARKRAEEALQASQEFNGQIITNARDGIIVYDSTLTYLLWNPAMEEISGWRAEDLVGRRAVEVFPAMSGAGIYERLERALRGETLPREDIAYDFGLKKGFYSRLDAPLRDETGAIVGVISTVSEITDRKKAEAELLESKQFNQEIIASANEGIVVYDRDFYVRIWNPAMETFSGLPAAQVLGQNIFDLYPEFLETAVPERLNEALAGKTSVSKDFQLRTAGLAQPAWLAARYGPHRNRAGEVVGVISVIRDVTARKLAEDQLRKSEERYREILATLQDGYWELDLNAQLSFFNEAVCEIFGRTQEEMNGRGVQQFLAEETKQRAHEMFRQLLKTGVPVKTFEFEIVRPDATARALETSITLMRQADGSPGGFRGIVRDVTERKQAERLIKERDERFRALIENSYDGIVLISADNKTLYISPSYTRQHGYSLEEVLDTTGADRIHPDDWPKLNQLRENLAPGASVPIEYRLCAKTGGYRWVEGRITNLLEEPSVCAYVLNFHDISERKAAETERAQAEAKLQASEARFRALVENGFDGISLQDAEGRITYVSPAYERVLGYLPEEVLGRQPLARVHPDDVDEALRAREEVGQTPGASRSLQFRTQHKDGSWRWLEVTMTNLLQQPDVGSIIVNFRDITERRASEVAVRESEEKFRAIWDNALDGMLIVNDDMQYVDANPAACRLYGVTRAELLAQTMADFVKPDNKDVARRSLQKLVEQGERTGHFQLLRSDHTLHEIEYNARANFLPGLHLSMMRDVTERHRAAESLRTSEEQYRSLVSVLEEGILMLDSEGELLTCNESCERILGARRDALRERALINPEWRAIREDGTPFPADEAPSVVTLRTGKPCSGVVLGVIRPDGNHKWLSVSSQPVFHQDSDELQAVVLSISDITQRKHAEAALRESELRFSAAFDDSPLAVSLTEQATECFVNVNQAWCKLFGITSVEAIGHTELELGLWEAADERAELYRQMALHGGAWEQEARLKTCAGRIVQALVSVRAMTLGQKQYVIVLVHDITERKLAEERFAKAFNANPSPMAISSLPAGKIVQVNETWASFTGFDFDETRGKTAAELEMWVEPGHRERFFALLEQQGRVREFETCLRRKDGAVHTILLSGETIDLGGQPHMLSSVTDITARKQAEEDVRVSQERFAKAFNACPEPMVLQRLENGCYISVNRACLTALGLEEDEMLGRTADAIDLWVNADQRRAMGETLRKVGEVRDVECDYYVGSGRIGHFLVSAEIIEIEGVQHVLSVARDITERKRAEEALRASEERFAKAFNSSPQPIAITSLPEGRFVTVNEAWTRVMGHSVEDTIGRDAVELDLWVNRAQRKQMNAKLSRGETIRDQELTLRAKNGELRYLIVYGEAIQLAGEDYLLLTAQNVTERKLAEQALRATEERFRLLFKRNLAGVYRATAEGQYLECNDAYATMFGFASPEELKDTEAWWIYPDQQLRAEMLEQLRRQGGLNNYEMQLRRKDGSAVWALANITYREADGQTPAIIEGIALDITKRKLDEAKLAESREQLRALSARLAAIREEERTAIAREIHDSLGQMLTGLKLDVAWLHKRLTNGTSGDAQEALVQKAEGMASLLDDTIQTVRDLATQLRPGVLDTLGLTAAIEWQVQDFQARTGIECEIWLCPEPKDLPQEKATALFRILQEILTNIIRHADATRVVIHLLPRENALLLSVADNGRGITTGNLRDGKSLGLLGMRERALMVGGEVDFEGSHERGTTVTVKVPV
ncbi:MAG: PAS domain S-box protein [Acidobacteria bacterium]|nr:PAS domain S-box protein [Acidobacteriota bacterium]MBI3423816.1 PAS domain S-box protein [Acidobacteriota bacterium]